MKYRVYADQESYAHIVKRGFAWPAFFIPEIWLFLRGLPIDAFVSLALLVGAIIALPLAYAAAIALSIRVLAGFVARRRIEAMFRSKGWRYMKDIEARTHMDALKKAALAAGTFH